MPRQYGNYAWKLIGISLIYAACLTEAKWTLTQILKKMIACQSKRIYSQFLLTISGTPLKITEVYWPKLISLAHLKVFNKVTGIWPKYDAT